MNRKTKLKTFLLILFLSLVCWVAGCNRSDAQVRVPTMTGMIPSSRPTGTITVTPSPTSTRIITETVQDTPTPTTTATPTPFIPTSTPLLSETGPWLMLSRDNGYTGPARAIGPILSNADGSGWEPVKLPRDPHNPPEYPEWWFVYFAPKGPYVAFQDYESEYEPRCDKDEHVFEWMDTLYLIKLPENSVVRQFRLFGQQSSAQINKEECEIVSQGSYDTPPVLGVIANNGNASWSPDGRYLAFVAAPDGPAADIYLYDTQTDNLRRLTNRQNNPDILGWSPDGQNIVYRSVTRMNLFHVTIKENTGLFAVSLSGTDRLLFVPIAVLGRPEWLTDGQFVIDDGLCVIDGSGRCGAHLRLVDLSTGENEVLYHEPNNWLSFEVDPVNHLLLFIDPPVSVIAKGP